MHFLSFMSSVLEVLSISDQLNLDGVALRANQQYQFAELNSVPSSTRAHWMRRANAALLSVTGTPCPFAAFGTVIVNHSAPGLGESICIGANMNSMLGNPALHGEVAAIDACSQVLTDPEGAHKLTPAEALAAWTMFSLYTNAESCPMCASAIRWAGMREYIYGTSIEKLVEMGWGQIDIGSTEVFERSGGLPGETSLLGGVLSDETDPYFSWQFNEDAPCPKSCGRQDGTCQSML